MKDWYSCRKKLYVYFNVLISAVECQMKCQQNIQCVVFQYNKFSGNCEFKNAPGPSVADSNMLNGPAFCNSYKSKCCFWSIKLSLQKCLKFLF
jgi:hypothetical protein